MDNSRSGSRRVKDFERRVRVLLLSQRPDWFERRQIWRQLPGQSLVQDTFQLTFNQGTPSDVCIVLNHLPYDTQVRVNSENLWNWHCESWSPNLRKSNFSRVFSGFASGRNVETRPPIVDWWVHRSFDELWSSGVPEKKKVCSCIASVRRGGSHKQRFDFVSILESSPLGVDVFGHGRNRVLRDKWEGLAPYAYSICIENKSQANYWTEKIADAFLAFCVPFYWGCTNIDEYFPPDSYVWLPIDSPEEALSVVAEELSGNRYQERLEAVREARELILSERGFFGAIRREIEEAEISVDPGKRRNLVIPGVRKDRPFRKRKASTGLFR